MADNSWRTAIPWCIGGVRCVSIVKNTCITRDKDRREREKSFKIVSKVRPEAADNHGQESLIIDRNFPGPSIFMERNNGKKRISIEYWSESYYVPEKSCTFSGGAGDLQPHPPKSQNYYGRNARFHKNKTNNNISGWPTIQVAPRTELIESSHVRLSSQDNANWS